MTSVLITGGAGFIGSHLAETLAKEGYKVIIIDDLSTGKMENLESVRGEVNFIKGSILDIDLLVRTIKKQDVEHVFHQAAWTSVLKSIKDPLKTNEVNVTGTLNALKSSVDNGVEKVIAASSSSVYGDTPELPKKESMGCRPKSPYAVSKLSGEHYLKVFSEVYGIKTTGLRYFNVYGPKQDPYSPYAAVVPKFINLALENRDLPVEGDGNQTRDFTYVDDVVEGNILAMEKSAEGIFNIAYGERTSINDLAEEIIRLTDSSSKIIHVDPRPGDVRDSLADISLAKEKLGYKPKYDLGRGLEKFVKWQKGI